MDILTTIIIVLHVIVSLALVVLILLHAVQRFVARYWKLQKR